MQENCVFRRYLKHGNEPKSPYLRNGVRKRGVIYTVGCAKARHNAQQTTGCPNASFTALRRKTWIKKKNLNLTTRPIGKIKLRGLPCWQRTAKTGTGGRKKAPETQQNNSTVTGIPLEMGSTNLCRPNRKAWTAFLGTVYLKLESVHFSSGKLTLTLLKTSVAP